ncbi:hypothetical protein GLAREA_02821 [Glarea lozoyensis ATCC 20868]|uniref:Uncharacterized protein n=1 Tax=Glarea lozoyensis (strain ATCC 20868 / MF5171) TaxID=1116229 RepID=S3CK74_GLAL2|nr:uncharacterized protein GLAREA_02821 [Glarea lozoyensis ATCC 20868]EPE26907.1 hypothetical protein GLAREA_02821 [Glarea lozoyensis ATCC 20868]
MHSTTILASLFALAGLSTASPTPQAADDGSWTPNKYDTKLSTEPSTTTTEEVRSDSPTTIPFPPNSGALAGKKISIANFPFGYTFKDTNLTRTSISIQLDTPFVCSTKNGDNCSIGDLAIDICSNTGEISPAQYALIQCRTSTKAHPDMFVAFNSVTVQPFVVPGTGNTKTLEILECRVMPEGQNVIEKIEGVETIVPYGRGFCSGASPK